MTYPYSEWFPHAEINGTFGFDPDDLREIPPILPPDDFASVWESWFISARTTAAEPEFSTPRTVDSREVHTVTFTASNELRLRGWIAGTRNNITPRVGIVFGHGYGGRDEVQFERVPDDAVVIFPVARGLDQLNAHIGAPNDKNEHIVFGIESIDDYVLGRCAVDLWHAANVLSERHPNLPLYYIGESFGGGVGALALPWDSRFVGATLIVPSFGQYDERLKVTCRGSGEVVRRHVEEHPSSREVLRYFDASSAALLTRVPVRVECALWDEFVPPQGQFAVSNGYCALEREILPAGHDDYPSLAAVLAKSYAATRAHIETVLASR